MRQLLPDKMQPAVCSPGVELWMLSLWLLVHPVRAPQVSVLVSNSNLVSNRCFHRRTHSHAPTYQGAAAQGATSPDPAPALSAADRAARQVAQGGVQGKCCTGTILGLLHIRSTPSSNDEHLCVGLLVGVFVSFPFRFPTCIISSRPPRQIIAWTHDIAARPTTHNSVRPLAALVHSCHHLSIRPQTYKPLTCTMHTETGCDPKHLIDLVVHT